MERDGRAIYGYGVVAEAGRLECIDCGHPYDHGARALLPPCPRYQDATHPRAGWRVRSTEAHAHPPLGSRGP